VLMNGTLTSRISKFGIDMWCNNNYNTIDGK